MACRYCNGTGVVGLFTGTTVCVDCPPDEMEGLKEFFEAYVECALWSTTDNSRDDGGDPLDDNYGPEDLSDELREAMLVDCRKFLVENDHLLRSAEEKDPTRTIDIAGHDFWLTRNGHGAGFWDGDWPEPEATKLTAASKLYGEECILVGDDGKLHG